MCEIHDPNHPANRKELEYEETDAGELQAEIDQLKNQLRQRTQCVNFWVNRDKISKDLRAVADLWDMRLWNGLNRDEEKEITELLKPYASIQ